MSLSIRFMRSSLSLASYIIIREMVNILITMMELGNPLEWAERIEWVKLLVEFGEIWK